MVNASDPRSPYSGDQLFNMHMENEEKCDEICFSRQCEIDAARRNFQGDADELKTTVEKIKLSYVREMEENHRTRLALEALTGVG